MGLPFTSGFYSKDIIIERCIWRDSGFLGIVCSYLSVFLTGFYAARMVSVICFGESFMPFEAYTDRAYWAVCAINGLGVSALLRGCFFQSVFFSFREYLLVPGF